MSKIYFTSDLHLFHNKPFLYEPRGFNTTEDMVNQIVENWNNTVAEDDIVWVLGDCILNDNISGVQVLKKLNGHKHLIIGNHDTDNRIQLYKDSNIFESIQYATILKHKKYHFYLSHYPTLCSNSDEDKPLKARVVNLCGHCHTTDKWSDWSKGLIYHVELDAHNCQLVEIETILNDIQNKINESYIVGGKINE